MYREQYREYAYRCKGIKGETQAKWPKLQDLSWFP